MRARALIATCVLVGAVGTAVLVFGVGGDGSLRSSLPPAVAETCEAPTLPRVPGPGVDESLICSIDDMELTVELWEDGEYLRDSYAASVASTGTPEGPAESCRAGRAVLATWTGGRLDCGFGFDRESFSLYWTDEDEKLRVQLHGTDPRRVYEAWLRVREP